MLKLLHWFITVLITQHQPSPEMDAGPGDMAGRGNGPGVVIVSKASVSETITGLLQSLSSFPWSRGQTLGKVCRSVCMAERLSSVL